MFATPTVLARAMRCVEIANKQLQLTTRSIPTLDPKSSNVLIRVAYAGVNRPDVVQRMGHYKPPPGASDLPGLEVSGVIEECPRDVEVIGADGKPLQVGTEVCALLSGGG